MHRIEQYSGCEIPDTMQEPMCGRAAGAVSGVTRTYVDYLHMRIQRGYDLHNQIFLFPRDLRLAHDQMVVETNAEEIRKREQAVSEKYPDIRKNYRGLRNQLRRRGLSDTAGKISRRDRCRRKDPTSLRRRGQLSE